MQSLQVVMTTMLYLEIFFSDIGRKFVTSNGHEQPCSAHESVSDSSVIPLQGSVEVLTFLKGCFFSSVCIFSSNWHYSIFK